MILAAMLPCQMTYDVSGTSQTNLTSGYPSECGFKKGDTKKKNKKKLLPVSSDTKV